MKVLIVSLNRNRTPVAVLPYGACAAAQAAADAGHEVRLLDLMFERDPAAALERACRGFRPDVAGFSLRNIDNNDASAPAVYYREAAGLVALARRFGAVTVLGGAAMAIMPEPLLRAAGADWGAVGDAGTMFPPLLAALSAGLSPLGIPGVFSAAPGGAAGNPAEFPPPDWGALLPSFGRWVDLRAYRRLGSPVPLKTKLGCPFGCVYCTYSLGEGEAYRLCPPEEAARAARALAAAGVRDVELVDNVFNSPYDHAMRLCAALKRDVSGVRFHTSELNPAFTDAPLLEAMRGAGFASFGITAESADEGVLAALGKNYGVEQLEVAASAAAAQELPCVWVFLLGGPGETRGSVLRTLDFARRRVRPRDAAFFNVGIRVYPGTPLEAAARREGSLAQLPEDMLEPVFYRPTGLDMDWLREELDRTLAGNLNFIGPRSLASPLLPVLSRAAGLAGLRPPLWKYAATMRRALRAIGAGI